MTGIDSIAAERRRQVKEEGWTQDHDDNHAFGEMASAAACYSLVAGIAEDNRIFDRGVEECENLDFLEREIVRRMWPFDRSWWKPKSRREDLVRAGALIAAEIDRIDRAEALLRLVGDRKD